ncbi:MAG: bifunctional phosphopantothenoylcysteine decarboxylase/phosphopantothenate--cysteine ligase CoaBC [Mariprofundaceae bacterium]|nr:bifunctional phosphopantothenoylcysteine decarboxylase/phosphopantothenate--cysteine ligase CoaBC [Mariprofundaceae bacterium]
MLEGRKILIGIGGGIAVYRIAELARLLIRQGAEVRCVMTRSACEFVTPLTFEAVTGEAVHTELFDLTSERTMGHIQLARWADAVVIAPATANLIAKLAYGIADDLLTTIMQVNDKPVLIAPAMNHSMWESSATRQNVETLKSRHIHFSGPASGELACGETGPGRLNEPETILDDLIPLLHAQKLSGQHWVINAGPTWEAWDSVRLLTNRASGRLGAHIADNASALGARVTLIAGPGTPECSRRVKRIDVESASDMLEACQQHSNDADAFIGTAAVSDFSFKDQSTEKLKRGDLKQMQVELTANPDIIATIAAMDGRPACVIAFAAESSDHVRNACDKLARKGVDAVFANDVANMGSTLAGGWWVTPDGNQAIEALPKPQLARKIIEKIMELNDE